MVYKEHRSSQPRDLKETYLYVGCVLFVHFLLNFRTLHTYLIPFKTCINDRMEIWTQILKLYNADRRHVG